MLKPLFWKKHLGSILKKAICMGKQSGGFYAVRQGRCPGIYLTWAECESQVKGFSNARYKKFCTEKEALLFIQDSSNKNDSGSLSQLDEVKSLSQALKDANFTVDPTPQQSSTNSLKKNTVRSPIQRTKRKLEDFTTKEKEENTVKLPTQQKKRKLEDTITEGKEGAESSNSVFVYTDGACCSNGREGAKAAIGVYWGPNHPLNVSERLPGRQTNNRAEIHAAVRALQQAKEIGASNVTVYTDSNFLVKAITKWIFGWKKNGWKLSTGERVKNKEDFEALERAKKGLKVNWIHVRGHQGIYGNEQADRLAVEALDKSL